MQPAQNAVEQVSDIWIQVWLDRFMKIVAAIGTSGPALEVINSEKYPNILSSFAYPKGLDNIDYIPNYLIIDSGAFTAWNIGKQVDIEKYAEYVLQRKEKFPDLKAVNLDVIPGEVGRTSTKKERAQGMKDSLKNADYLRGCGIEVMEVFHQDEPRAFLDTLCDRLPVGGILCISPRNDVHQNEKIKWQNAVLRHLCERYGPTNLPRMHGLAVTAVNMMRTFPYYSVDSSSWMSPSMWGRFINEDGRFVRMETAFPKNPRGKEAEKIMNLMTREGLRNWKHIGMSNQNLWFKRGVKWRD